MRFWLIERSKFTKRIIFSDRFIVIYVVYEFWRHAVLIITLKPSDFYLSFKIGLGLLNANGIFEDYQHLCKIGF